jgi:opacity protein-like surface antigen
LRLAALLVCVAAPAAAQPLQGPPIEVAGFAHFGRLSLAATKSFDAILGSSSGPIVGGGGEVTFNRGWLRNVFVRVDVSRFEETGQRVFVFNGEVFTLGIPATITLTPVDVSAGFRYRRTVRGGPGQRPQYARLVPYAGLGFGSTNYRETSSFAAAEDDVDERFTSYQAFGGADVRLWKGLSAGAEAVYRWVPDALDNGSGVSEAFNESNLDGATVRVRVRYGF